MLESYSASEAIHELPSPILIVANSLDLFNHLDEDLCQTEWYRQGSDRTKSQDALRYGGVLPLLPDMSMAGANGTT